MMPLLQRRRPPLLDADFFRGARVDAGVVGADKKTDIVHVSIMNESRIHIT